MPGFLLDVTATVLCAHGGLVRATTPAARVLLGGAPAVTQPTPCTVTGCALPPPAGGPCVTAQWTAGAVRVRADGVPLLLADSPGLSAPPATPVTVALTQVRVRGT